MPSPAPIEVDLAGRTPIPRWQLVAGAVLLAGMLTLIGLDFAGVPVLPTARKMQAVDQRTGRLESELKEVRQDTDALREEMRAGFLRLEKAMGDREP